MVSTVVWPPTIPVIVVLPPIRETEPVILAALVTSPPDCNRLSAVPPVRVAVPLRTLSACRLPLDVRLDVPLTVVVPLTVPRIAVVPPVVFRVATWPLAFTVRAPLLLVVTPVTLPEARTVAVPLVKFSVPDMLEFTFSTPPVSTAKLPACVDVLFSVRTPAMFVTLPLIVPQLFTVEPVFTDRALIVPPLRMLSVPPLAFAGPDRTPAL